MNIFYQINNDYPARVPDKEIEYCEVSDSDIPSGNGGINSEGYSYGQLRRNPIIPELLDKISNADIKRYAEECNGRNADGHFRMFRIKGEYCFWGLRVGPTVSLPDENEMRQKLMDIECGRTALHNKTVTTDMIRNITYEIFRNKIACICGMTHSEASNVIGNVLDCAPHEDETTHLIFMVPNWAHRWFRHRGYASHMAVALNS